MLKPTEHLETLEIGEAARVIAEREGIRRVPLHRRRHICVLLLLAQGLHPRTVMEIVGHSAIE